MYFYKMIEKRVENNQINEDDFDVSSFHLDKNKLKDEEIQKFMLSNKPVTLENISKMFSSQNTERENPCILNINEELVPYLNDNNSTKLPLNLESEPYLDVNDSFENSIFNGFITQDNDYILSNLKINLNDLEKAKQIIPSNEKQDKINAMNKHFNFIFEILKKINYPIEKIKEIKEDIITPKDIENIWLFEVKSKKKKNEKRRKKKIKTKDTIEKKEIEKSKKVKYGRKSLNNSDTAQGNHKKDCPDNIIKKIKAFLFSRVIKYVQEYININKINMKEKIKLLTLDYKNVNRLEKKFNLKILKEPLKDLISREISSRYRAYKDKYWNRNIINKVLDKEENNDKINSLLNMSFGKWIDIFTYKQKWEYNIELKGIKPFLEKIQKENDSHYFSKVIFYLFNYQKWFLHKKGRKQKENKKQK